MKFSIIVFGDTLHLNDSNVSIIYSTAKNIINDLKKVNTKYVTFVKSDDEVAKNYVTEILKVINNNFDCCFINSKINYSYINEIKALKNSKELSKNKPYKFEYIWNYVFNTEKLITLLNDGNSEKFDELVDKLFVNTTSIPEVIYYHNCHGKAFLTNSMLLDKKNTKYYKNIIYVGDYCNGVFNGYISWLKNIGKCFTQFDITVIYDNLLDINYKELSKYFNLEKYDKKWNYTCDRLLVTFSTFYYPKNIIALEANYLFIHANMSDYKGAIKYNDDIYTRYIAVSKPAANKAIGYFNTDKILYLYNPFQLDKDMVTPHLKLVSAQRSSAIKKSDRIKQIADILNEENIPYTWNVFTDKNEGTNYNGLIYRERVANPLPYIKDSDYFILLSDSEACPYSVLEALELNTKLVVTPLEVYNELGVKEGENAIIIPFEYFEKENKEKLREKVLDMYTNIDKVFNYSFDSKKYEGYKYIFK